MQRPRSSPAKTGQDLQRPANPCQLAVSDNDASFTRQNGATKRRMGPDGGHAGDVALEVREAKSAQRKGLRVLKLIAGLAFVLSANSALAAAPCRTGGPYEKWLA